MNKLILLTLGFGLLFSVHTSQAFDNKFVTSQPPVLDNTVTLSNKNPVPSPEIPDDPPVSDIKRVCLERPKCLDDLQPCKIGHPIDSNWCPPNPTIEPLPTTIPLPSIIASPSPTLLPLPLPTVSPQPFPTPFWWPFKKAEVTLHAQIQLCFDNKAAYEDKFWVCADVRFPFNLLGKWGNCRPIMTKKTGDGNVATGTVKLWSARNYTLYPPTKSPNYLEFSFSPKSFTLDSTGQTVTVTVSNSMLGCPVSYPVPIN